MSGFVLSQVHQHPLAKYLNAFLPPIMWASLIFILSSQSVLPSLDVSTVDFLTKKLAHMFVYFVLYLLFFRGVSIINSGPNAEKTKKQLLIPVLFCLLYAISDEIHQSFIPHRTPTIRDVGYDLLGIMIGFLKQYHYF